MVRYAVLDYTDRVDVLSHKLHDQLVRENRTRCSAQYKGCVLVPPAGCCGTDRRCLAQRSAPAQAPAPWPRPRLRPQPAAGGTAVFLRSERFIRRIFEVGRRHAHEPERMRTEYGKMMHILQDATDDAAFASDLQRARGAPYTATSKKRARAGIALQSERYTPCDPRLVEATRPVRTGKRLCQKQSSATSARRHVVSALALVLVPRRKQCGHGRRRSCAHGRGRRPTDRMRLPPLPRGALQQTRQRIVGSVSDAAAFVQASVMPCEIMLQHLADHFDPTAEPVVKMSGGPGHHRRPFGARLTHSHRTQYHYVLQTLMLWREVARDMFRLCTLLSWTCWAAAAVAAAAIAIVCRTRGRVCNACRLHHVSPSACAASYQSFKSVSARRPALEAPRCST